MNVIVTGSRHAAMSAHYRVVESTLVRVACGEPVTLIEGGAPGVDTLAKKIAEAHGWPWVEVAARWGECGPDCPPGTGHLLPRAWWDEMHGDGPTYCPGAGPRRNRLMVDTYRVGGRVAAFPAVPKARRSGTWDTIEYAVSVGVPVLIVGLRTRGRGPL